MTETLQTPPAAHGLLKSVLLGLLILTAGIAIGASATFLGMSRQRAAPAEQAPEVFAERMLRRLDRDLNLRPEQRRRLEPVLQEHYRALQHARSELRPRIVQQLALLDHDIASVLDEEQDRIWQQQVQRLDEHFPTLRERRRATRAGRGRGVEPDQRGLRDPDRPFGPGRRRDLRQERTEPDEAPREPPPPSE